MTRTDPTLPAVAHDPAAHRFSLAVDGHQAVLDYLPRDGAMVITHTGVPEAIGGRGIAAQLTRAALAHARQAGIKVVPECSYAAAFMQRHGEYADLLG